MVRARRARQEGLARMEQMKLYVFTAQHKLYGHWEDVKLSDGSLMFVTLTTNDASALNTGCKPDFRWIGPSTIHTIEVNTKV